MVATGCVTASGEVPYTATSEGCDQVGDFQDVSDFVQSGYSNPELSVVCDANTVYVSSNGIPNFDYVQVTPNSLSTQNYVWTLPRYPQMAGSTTDVPLGGAAAIAVNGLPIFGPTEAPDHGYRDPYLDDILDYCNGHTAPRGDYHFHAPPECIFDDYEGNPTLVVGYAFDGYPIMAPFVCDDDGCTSVTEVQSSYRLIESTYGETIENAWDAHEYVPGLGDLDECNGTETSDGGYAYFATETFPYFMGCYVGEVDEGNMAGGR